MKNIQILLLVTLAFVVGCKDEEPVIQKQPAPKDYSGIWEGEYSGADEGPLQIIIDSSNMVKGQGYSGVIKQYFTLDGSINANGSTTSITSNLKITFSGQFDDSTASGTWKNTAGDLSGEWVVER